MDEDLKQFLVAIEVRLHERLDVVERRFDARFEQIDARFEQIDARFEQIDTRFEQIDARFEQIEARIEATETKLLTAFHNWASPMDMRARTHAAAIKALDAEYEYLSDRVTKLDGGGLGGKSVS